MLSIKISTKSVTESSKKKNEFIEKAQKDINYILTLIKTYNTSFIVDEIYIYGSAYTGHYGKSDPNGPGDIDLFVVIKDNPDYHESDWFSSEEYREASMLEGYDLALIQESEKDTMYFPNKLLYKRN